MTTYYKFFFFFFLIFCSFNYRRMIRVVLWEESHAVSNVNSLNMASRSHMRLLSQNTGATCLQHGICSQLHPRSVRIFSVMHPFSHLLTNCLRKYTLHPLCVLIKKIHLEEEENCPNGTVLVCSLRPHLDSSPAFVNNKRSQLLLLLL